MTKLIGEFIGTMLLILLGDGVVANVVLKNTKGNCGGWIVITFGWGMGVFVGVFTVASISGAHINPAVTLTLAAVGQFPWVDVLPYIAAQILGAAFGAFLVWLFYYQHFAQTEDKVCKLAVFCTTPQIRNRFFNFVSEVIGTFVLTFCVLCIAKGDVGLGALDALPVALLVLAIGLSLGGTTGYAINPARDLGPRLMHSLLPVPGKGSSDWGYAWIPIVGPLTGALLAAGIYSLVF